MSQMFSVGDISGLQTRLQRRCLALNNQVSVCRSSDLRLSLHAACCLAKSERGLRGRGAETSG